MVLCFSWHFQSKKVGEKLEIQLDSGDMYIMSEKAVGTDWKKRSIYTLRHSSAAIPSKFTN